MKPLKYKLSRDKNNDGSILVAIMLGIGLVVCMFMV